MAGNRGSIAFFASYRPPVPLDIFSCPLKPNSTRDEVPMTDGKSYNYNGQVIPPAALKTILKRPIFAKSKVKEAEVKSAIIFVSERNELEILHIALTFNNKSTKVKVFSLAEVFPDAIPEIFNGVRMEDSASFAGVADDYLIYITTKKLVDVDRRQPWTKVYKTNLKTGETKRLTPSEQADLSPAVSPSKTQIAVATFQRKGGWKGQIEDLETNIYVMNVEKPYNRRLLVENGGWPTWGSENIIFFHRKLEKHWGVYRLDISTGEQSRVTPDKMDAITPAAIDHTTVAVATIYQKPDFNIEERVEAQYRHIEIFYSTGQEPLKITKNICSMADYFNPFVIDGGKRIGYHRSIRVHDENEGVKKRPLFETLESPDPNYELFRLPGVFPSFSKDGTKLAFVDNEFKKVWIADSRGLRKVYEARDNNGVFAPVWNQNPDKDILYLCVGPSFKAKDKLDIGFIRDVSTIEDVEDELEFLTKGFNNAFPSTSPDGTKLVFRSTRGGDTRYKNLYVIDDIESGLYEEEKIKQITSGKHVDTQCQWAPKGDWIVFASSRSKNFIPDAPATDNGLDSGYFAVYLVNAEKPDVVLRLMRSGIDFAGHVNHPFFSPDGKSIVVTADLAAVSVEPISLPLFVHSVRPYGDIFIFDIDLDNMDHHDDRKEFTRITHSKYEYSTATWTLFSAKDQNPEWRQLLGNFYVPSCPYVQANGGESKHMIGHLCIPFSCC